MTDASIYPDQPGAPAPAWPLRAPRAEGGSGLADRDAGRPATTPASAGRLPPKPANLELTLYADLAAIEPIWRAFESEASHTFFQSFAWLDAWQRHVGALLGVVPTIVTGRHPDGTLLFILPLAIERRRGVRHLRFLGSELCDYNAPMLHPRFAELVEGSFPAQWRRIVALLRADPRFAFDVVDLQKMPERVGEQPNPLLALGTVPNPSGAYLTRLTGTWDEFYAEKRSSGTRKKERKQLRQLGEFGEVRFVDALEGEERARTLDLLFEQKAASFARMGVRNIFTRPGYRELFTAFVLDPRSRPYVHLSRLEVGSTIAAASIGFTAVGCYYLVLSSYLARDMARFGPGRTHLQELLQYAIRNGFSAFDFTIGDELYKQDWSDARLTLHDHLSAANLRGSIAVGLTTGFRAAKRTIKQNPVMWQLFSRARSRLGAMRTGGAPPAAGDPAQLQEKPEGPVKREGAGSGAGDHDA
jgi:CelD/BcsL family acetyltransferase involved in cellulose biosynthesis